MQEEIDRRLSICYTCPLNNEGMCEKAGMYLTDFVHLRLAYCPEFKWG